MGNGNDHEEHGMYPIEIHANGRTLTRTEAISAAMGRDPRVVSLVVTAVYAKDTEGGKDYHGRQIIHKAGSPVFGLDAEIRARQIQYGEDSDALVSISGLGSHSPEVAAVRIECYRIAAEIAATANATAATLKAGA
jgi:hypothetical protein